MPALRIIVFTEVFSVAGEKVTSGCRYHRPLQMKPKGETDKAPGERALAGSRGVHTRLPSPPPTWGLSDTGKTDDDSWEDLTALHPGQGRSALQPHRRGSVRSSWACLSPPCLPPLGQWGPQVSTSGPVLDPSTWMTYRLVLDATPHMSSRSL